MGTQLHQLWHCFFARSDLPWKELSVDYRSCGASSYRERRANVNAQLLQLQWSTKELLFYWSIHCILSTNMLVLIFYWCIHCIECTSTLFSLYFWCTVRSGAEERTFWGARLDVLIFRLRSYHVIISCSAECTGPKFHKTLMFLGQAGMFLSVQARRSSATRSSTSDLTVFTVLYVPTRYS